MVLGNYYLTMDPTAEIVCLKKRAAEFRTWEALKKGGYKIAAVYNSAGSRQIEYRELDSNNTVTILKDGKTDEGRKYKAFDQLVDGLVQGRFIAIHNGTRWINIPPPRMISGPANLSGAVVPV
jgi:hypothetical protein